MCFLVILLPLCFSCSREKPAENPIQGSAVGGTSTYSLEITPVNATRNTTLYAVTHGFEIGDAEVEWIVNASRRNSTAPGAFDAGETRKNDSVQARAIIRGVEVFSNIVEIANTPPEIAQVKLVPESFAEGEVLRVEASGQDADGDDVELTYKWKVNGEPAGEKDRLGRPVKAGDKIEVEIVPFDGEIQGRPLTLHRQIGNLPPAISGKSNPVFEGDLLTFQLHASDPDKDTLSYAIKNGPAGMSVDPSSGLVRWSVPPDYHGKASFSVSVTDGRGGEATQVFNIEVSPGIS